jgi:hypothetical protein
VIAFLTVNGRRLSFNPREVVACVIFITVLLGILVSVVNPLIRSLRPEAPLETTTVGATVPSGGGEP